MSSGSQQTVHYVGESQLAVLPAPFDRNLLRFKSMNIDGTTSGTASEEILDNPLSNGEYKTKLEISGELGAELSFGTYDEFIAAIFRNYWTPVDPNDVSAGQVLTLGSRRDQSFSFLRGYKDAGGYHVFRGNKVKSMGITVPKEGLIEINFNFVGQERDPVVFQMPAGNVAFPNPNKVMTNVGVGELLLDGVSVIDQACMSAFAITFEWDVQNQICLGKGLTAGKAMQTSLAVTGSVTVAWGDMAANYNEMKYTDKSIALTLPLSDEAGNTYVINVPEATIKGALPSGSRSDLIEMQIEYTVRKQSPTITRIPSKILPVSQRLEDTLRGSAGSSKSVKLAASPENSLFAGYSVAVDNKDIATAITSGDMVTVNFVGKGSATLTVTNLANPKLVTNFPIVVS